MRLDGLPVHPVTVHFPIALLTTTLLWDGIGLWTGASLWWVMSFWSLAIGLASALPAIVTGFVEYARLPSENPAQSTATWHLMITASAVSLFLVSLLVRGGPDVPSGARLIGALACSGIGLLLLTVGGHFGARLVYQYGVGSNSEPET